MVEDDRLRRAQHVSADGVNRADARLRSFGRREGDAVMCPSCDGAGVVMGRALSPDPLATTPYAARVRLWQPVKCGMCNGEGLDPDAIQGEG